LERKPSRRAGMSASAELIVVLLSSIHCAFLLLIHNELIQRKHYENSFGRIPRGSAYEAAIADCRFAPCWIRQRPL